MAKVCSSEAATIKTPLFQKFSETKENFVSDDPDCHYQWPTPPPLS